jgi:peptide/nickel transport system permease protein
MSMMIQQFQGRASDTRESTRGRLAGSPALKMAGRRLLTMIPVLLGVSILTFALMGALPNDTAQSILGQKATPAAVNALNHQLGLDQPFWVRYWHWLVGVLHGNLGSTLEHQSINHELAVHLPVTLEMLAYALIVSLLLSVAVAVLAARKPNGAVDRTIGAVIMLGLSAGFVIAFFAIIVFGVWLNWFPIIVGTPSGGFLPVLRELTLPAFSIGFGLWAIYTQVLRADLVEQMQREDYIVTAKAKGLPPWRVLLGHALRNSLFTLITVVGLNLGQLVGIAAIIEAVFSVPGIGQDLLSAIAGNDVPLIEAIVLVFAVVTVLGSFLADLLYAVLDPRIRYGSS